MRARNYLISWDKLDFVATKPSIPLSETKRTRSQGSRIEVNSVLRFTSTLPIKALYKILKLLFELAKFGTKRISGIREKLRS